MKSIAYGSYGADFAVILHFFQTIIPSSKEKPQNLTQYHPVKWAKFASFGTFYPENQVYLGLTDLLDTIYSANTVFWQNYWGFN